MAAWNVAYWHLADIRGSATIWSLLGVKRTSANLPPIAFGVRAPQLRGRMRIPGRGFKSDAALTIDVNAPPGSIRTRLAHSGFEDVQFNRGLQMAKASQVG